MELEAFEVVRVALKKSQVSRCGQLVLHPAAEVFPGWVVSHECGLSIGTFKTRAAAEHYLAAATIAVNWQGCPLEVDQASRWAQALPAMDRNALIAALKCAREIDANPQLPWEGE